MTFLRRALSEALDDATPLRLTLVIVLLRPPEEGWLRGAAWLIAGLALIVPVLTSAPRIWFLLATVMAGRLVADWPLADNHIFLLAYWCLAIALSLQTAAPWPTLSRASRRLLGLAFLCAIVWKGLLAPDFLDARFFRVTLMTDDRFADLAMAVGGLTPEQLAENRAALEPLPAGAELLDGPVLTEPASLRILALSLTWVGFVLEALIAIAFLSRWPPWLFHKRHTVLWLFCATTYAVAPVAGFGWLLAAMGLAQCADSQRGLRFAYVALFGIVLVYSETPLVVSVIRLLSQM
jgi:hypothetical protein